MPPRVFVCVLKDLLERLLDGRVWLEFNLPTSDSDPVTLVGSESDRGVSVRFCLIFGDE